MLLDTHFFLTCSSRSPDTLNVSSTISLHREGAVMFAGVDHIINRYIMIENHLTCLTAVHDAQCIDLFQSENKGNIINKLK